MRYLRITIPLAACVLHAGCAATSVSNSAAAARPARRQAVVQDDRAIAGMLSAGTVWLARDTATNGWVLRDSSGVIMTGISPGVPGPALGPAYGDCIAR